MWNLKRSDTNERIYKAETDSQTQGMNLWLPGVGGQREGIVREFGIDMYTQCYVAAWMGGESWGDWVHVYVWLSRFAVHLKLSQQF